MDTHEKRRKSQAHRSVSEAKLSALVSLLADSGPRARRAAKQLEQIGPQAVPALLRAYDSPHEHLRWEIVNLLGYIKDRRSLPLLLEQAIHDPELHPRWRSIWALSSVDDGRAVPHLRAQLARSRGRRRRNAAVALSIFEDAAAVPILRRGLSSEDNWIRWESASCLAGYQDPGVARDVLSLYRKERDPSIRREMIRAAAGVENPSLFRFFKRRLADPNADIRLAAVDALTRTADSRRARRALSARRRIERTRDVALALREALAALDDLIPS